MKLLSHPTYTERSVLLNNYHKNREYKQNNTWIPNIAWLHIIRILCVDNFERACGELIRRGGGFITAKQNRYA